MSNSLSLSPLGGGGGGDGGGRGSGMFFFSLCVELLSTKISFLSVVFFVISSSTRSRLGSTSPVDVQLQLFVCKFLCSVFSKPVFGRGVAP